VALRFNVITFGSDATLMDCTTGCAGGEEGAEAIPGTDVEEIEGYFGYEDLAGSDGTATFTWTTPSRVFCMSLEVE
jgi:hypothetical protein